MVERIIWKKTADRTFDNITTFLQQDKFSSRAAFNFAKLVYEKIDQLEKQPMSGRKVLGTKSVRVINFGTHYQMFYRSEGKTLVISAFWDMRRNPKTRPF